MRALGDLGIGLLEIEAYDGARFAFQIVIDSDADCWSASTPARADGPGSSVGNRVAFERCRSAVERIRDRPPSAATDYLLKLGTGLARFGQSGCS